MDLVLLQNSHSGRGAGRPLLESIVAAVRAAGHRVEAFDVGPGLATHGLMDALSRAHGMVIAGGDGTVHHASEHAIAAGVPLYHLPMGTENLFARHFRMDRRPETLLAALERPATAVDVGVCNGTRFLLMCSVGFDARVVQRVAAARTRGVTRLSYLEHGARELVAPRFVPLTVEVDGTPVVAERPGMVIVANSRQYAARLDPIPHASMTDGLLDVLFMPFKSRVRLASWTVGAALRRHLSSRAAVQARGRSVVIRGAGGELTHQLDGECGLSRARSLAGSAASGTLNLEVAPGALRVLAPA